MMCECKEGRSKMSQISNLYKKTFYKRIIIETAQLKLMFLYC